MVRIKRIILFCVLLFVCSFTETLKESAQQSFMSGEYDKAYELFTTFYNSSESSQSDMKQALRMRALLFEQYLGNIDSALILNKLYLEEFCTRERERKLVQKKIDFLSSLGENKSLYEEYLRTVFALSDDKSRTKSLQKFLKNNPTFFMRKEALKQCAIAALNAENYPIAFRSYKTLLNEENSLSQTEEMQYDLSKRMYVRYRVVQSVYIVWIVTFIIALREAFLVMRAKRFPTKGLIKVGGGWLLLLSLFLFIYKVKIIKGDHNPFRIEDMALMSFVFTISVLLTYSVSVRKSSQFYHIFAVVATTLTIIGTAYFTTYNRSDRITVMDDLYDQLGDFYIKEKDEKGQNLKD